MKNKTTNKIEDERGLMVRVTTALSGMGFGITVAFLFILLLMPPSAGIDRTLPYFLLGLWGGAFLFSIFRPTIVASGVAYIVSLSATLITAAAIVTLSPPAFVVMIPLIACSVIPYFSRVGGFMDLFLIPSTYFGGLITGLLVVMNSLSGSSDRIAMLTLAGVLGSIVSFFLVAFKFFMMNAKKRRTKSET